MSPFKFNREKWLGFFVEGVIEMAENAVETARTLVRVGNEDLGHIQQLGRSSGSCIQIHHALMRRPIGTIAWLSKETGLSVPTVTSALRTLEGTGLVREMTGQRRNKVFSYPHYLEILVEGTGQ